MYSNQQQYQPQQQFVGQPQQQQFGGQPQYQQFVPQQQFQKPAKTTKKEVDPTKRGKALMESLAEYYRSGEYASPHKTVKLDKSGIPKESYSLLNPKHTGTAARLATLDERIMVDQSLVNEKYDLTKTAYYPGLNLVGNISDISMYFAQRLAPSSTPFDLDAAQFGFAAFMLGLLHVDASVEPAVTVNSKNVNSDGKLRVLIGFEEYARAVEDSEKKAAVERLYNDFVLKIFNNCQFMFANLIRQLIGGDSNIGTYNSSASYRAGIRNQLKEYLSQYEQLSRSFTEIFNNVDGSTYYPSMDVDRKSWLNDKGTSRVINNENNMPIFEIPALALDAKVLTQVVALVPAKLRPKDKATHVVSYPILGLNPALAYKMAYATGIASTATELDVSPGQTLGETGNKRKALTIHQAAENLIKHFAGYYDISGKQSIVNMREILERKKYIEITLKTNPGQATGFQLAGVTANTALLYPDMQVPTDVNQGKQYFENNPKLAFEVIRYSLGFSVNKVAIAPEHIQQVIRQLYIIFGMEPPVSIQYNSLPFKTSNGSNAFGSMYGVQAVTYAPHQSQHHLLPTGFPTHHVGLDHSVHVAATGATSGSQTQSGMFSNPVAQSSGGSI
jgi:hypothetical protein